MPAKIAVELGAVQETLMIPLLGRARETQKPKGLLRDPRALELVESLDYDFSKFEGGPSLFGSCFRTVAFDARVQRFMDAHPEGSIIELGVGLNTRYERLDDGKHRWLELDLPDTLALRQQFFKDTPNRRMATCDLRNLDWLSELDGMPGPYCFVSEAVLIYLPEAMVKATLSGLAARMKGSTLITDLASSRMVNKQDSHDAMKKLGKDSYFQWCVDDPKSLEAWGYTYLESQDFFEAAPELKDRLSLKMRIALIYLAPLFRRLIPEYRVASYEV